MSEPQISALDVLNASAGCLQKQMYVYFTRPANGMGPVMENLEAHLKFQAELERKGVMFGAGPFWTEDEQRWEGEGMIIIRADSLAEARRIAESDPMHASGARAFTIRPWLLNEGAVTMRITYSDGGREVI